MKIFDKNFGAIAKGALWLTSALWLTICAAANATPDNNIDSLREIPISPNISQNGRGMAVASYLSLQAAIHLVDTPISYSPPFGQPMDFEISYNSAKASHPSALALSNLGPGWSFNWLSFVTLDSAKNVTVTTRSGSSEFFQFRIKESETIKTPYSSSQMSHAKLIQAAEGKFHRLLPDGSVEIFNKPDGTGRILLTQVKDPQGNTTHIEYDTNFRIASVVDAIGQKTTIKYASESSNSLGFFKIIEIKDPFGRTAKFQYDQSFMHLLSSTDTIGLVSKYKYDPGSFFVAALTTPYGTSLFKKYTPKGSPPESEGIRTTLPNGDSQVIEHWAGDVRETYEWDRHALKLFPSDPEKQEHSHCNTTHWQIDAPSKREIAIPTFYKRPLESKIVYSYDGPSEHGFAGSIDLPIAITREIRITNPDGSTGKAKQVKKFEYNSFGKITKEIDPLGRTFSYKYADNEIDLLEKRQTRDGSNELVANWTYNKQHRPVKDGALHRNIEYNNFGEVTKITDAYQNSTSFDYDSKGYLLKVEGAIPGMRNLAKYSYDALGRRHTKTDADGITVILAYDNADRLTSTTFPDGSSEQIRYDKLDAVAIRDRSGKETKRTYSNLDQLTSVEDPLGRKIQYSWCSCGSLLTMTDPIGKTTTWHHDLQGRTIQKKFADGTEFNYTYEEGGHRLQSITDALKQTTNYNYNLDDTKAKITFTNAVNPTSPVSFKYERDYKVIHSVTNDWGTITYNHSNPVSGAGPLKSIANSAIPNSTITFEYDALGHVTNRSIGSNNSDEWKFDKMGRPISEENVLGKFQFHYGETSQSASKNTKLSSIEYPNGLLTRFDYADAAESDYLKSIKTSLNTNEKVVSEFGYQQDKAGRLTNWNEAFDGKVAAQYSFSYDSAGQLTDAQDANTEKTVSRNYHYEYDQDSNRTLEKNDNGVTRLAYGSTNELLSVSNRASGPAQNSSAKAIAGSPAVHDSRFVYDANGNLLSDNKNSYKWDAENRLIQITYPGTGNYTTFTYNGAEKCAKITETSNNKISSIKQLIWSQNRICEIRDENGDLVTKLFAFGEEIVGQKYYFTRDHLGSTRLVSDSKGNIKSRLDYDPLGHTQQLHGEIVPDLQYAGYYSHKPSGLNLTVFRAYSSELGRWINRDPVGEFGLHRKPEWSLNNAKYEILASNLYAYANNNSIQFSDPFGLCPSTKGKMIPMDPKYDNSNSLKGSVQYTDIQGFDPNIYGSGPQAPDIGPSQLANIFDDNTDDVWPNPNQTPIEIASSDPSETGRTGPAQTSQPPPPPPQPTIPNQSAPQIIMGEAGKHFATPQDALKSWGQSVYAASTKFDKEYAAKVYKNLDGTWSYTPSLAGGLNPFTKDQTSNPSNPLSTLWTMANQGYLPQDQESYEIHSHGAYQPLNTIVVTPHAMQTLKAVTGNPNLTQAEAQVLMQHALDYPSPADRSKSEGGGTQGIVQQLLGLAKPTPQFLLTPGGDVVEYLPNPNPVLLANSPNLTLGTGANIKLGNVNSSASLQEAYTQSNYASYFNNR